MTSTINTSEIGVITDQSLQPNKFYGLLGIEGLTNVTAGVVYNATDHVFEFRKSTTVVAGVSAGKLWLYENKTNPANRINIEAPASINATYTLTLPDVAPTLNASALVFDATGVSSWASVLSSAAAFSQDGKYHPLVSAPGGLVEETDELETDEILVGTTANKPTPRKLAADTSGTTWSISATEVKLVLPQSLASTDAPTFAGVTVNGNITVSGTVDGVDISAHVTDTTTHGVLGDIVGTSDSQTLTTKTIDADFNTISNLEPDNLKTVVGDANKVIGYADTTGVPEAVQIANRHVASSADISWTKVGDAGGPKVLTGTDDPTAIAKDAYKGALYIRTSTGVWYKKQDDGSTTNWEQIESTVTSPLVLTVAPTGAPYSDIQEALDAITDAAINKRYAILVYPGVYSPFVIKSYIDIQGITTGVGAVRVEGATTLCSGTVQNDAFTSIAGVNFVLTPTTDNQYCIDVAGQLGFTDCFVQINTSSDVSYTAVRLTSSTVTAFSNGSITVIDTFSNSTKAKTLVENNCSGTFVMGTVAAFMTVTGGTSTHNLLLNTGTGPVVVSQFSPTYTNLASFSGVVCGVNTTSVGTGTRTVVNSDIRLRGVSGGTANALCINAGANAEFTYTGITITINGFSSENVTNTALGNTQKCWLQSTNKDLGKTGAGTAIVTPYDELRTGFVSWEGSAPYWSYNAGSRLFTVVTKGSGIVKSSPVVWAAGQTITLTDYAVNFVYMTSAGVIGVATAPSESLYQNNIVLFQVYSDGTNYVVCKENHPYKFNTAVSHAWHNVFKTLLAGTGAQVTVLSGAGRTISLTGDDTLFDHGLDTAIPASASALTWNVMRTGASGIMFHSVTTALPALWNDGTGTSSTGSVVVYRLGVIKDSLNSSAPQYVARMHTASFANISAARTACNANSIVAFDTVLDRLEIAQLGFAILTIGTNTLSEVIIARQTFGAVFASGAAASSAALVNTTTTNFNRILSGTESTVQLALDKLDDVVVQAKTPAASTDNAFARWDGASGTTIQDSTAATLDDSGNASFLGVTTTTGGVTTDLIKERTAANGVDIDGVLCKDGSVQVDSHVEFTELGSAPTTPSSGFGRLYRKTDGKLYVLGSDGIESAVGAGGTVDLVTQNSHGFTSADVGRPLYLNGSTYTLAKADDSATAEVVGLLSRYIDANKFEVTLGGEVTNVSTTANFDEAALPAAGATLFLSATNTGKLTVTEPSTVGHISKPVGVVSRNSAGSVDIYFYNMRGSVVGGANLYTTISLANNATTSFHTIQGIAGTGGWISGTIKIDATTDYVIPFFCHFSRQLDGTTYNVSPSFGDSIPSGLAIVNSGSSIQVTLPNLAGFVSASVTYCVQAAANGTTLPVSVSASSVVGSTSGSAPAAGVIGQKTISASLSKTPSTTAAWEVATGNFGTPSAGVYLLVTTLQTNGAASLTGVGAIINENGSSVTPVLSQTQGVASSVIGPITSKVQHYVTDGTKTLYGWAICYGATINVTITCELIRIG